GCGDSGDPPPGSPALAGWRDALDSACEQLLAVGVDEIAVVGLKIGATVGFLGATSTSGASSAVSGVALLAPHPTGRAYLRELRALEALAAETVYTQPAKQPPPLPTGALEAAGFFVSAEE